MSCSNLDKIEIDKGEHIKLTYKVVEPSETEPNVYNPKDLTGVTIEFQVKPKVGAPDPPTIEKSIGSGIVLLPQSGDTLGKFQVTIQTSDTSSVAAGSYAYDIVMIEAGERKPIRRASPFVINAVVNSP